MHQRIHVDAGPMELRLRTPSAHAPTVLAGLLAILVGISIVVALRPLNPASLLLGPALIAFGAWLTASAARAHVSLTRERLVERGDLRRRSIPTLEIVEFYVDRTPHVVPWFSIWVRLTSGEARALEQVRVFELRRGAGFEKLRQAATEMNRWLAEP